MLNFDPPVVKRSRWLQIRNRLGVVVRGGKRLDGFTTLVIVVVAAVLIPKIGSTFAGSITLNGDQAVEFGQGTVMTTACDESITITPTSRFSTATSTTSSPTTSPTTVPPSAFYLGDITVSGLDDEDCYDDMFTITVFDGNGSPIDICEENSGEGFYTSDALQLAYRDSIDSWVLISDCFFNQTGGSLGSTTGFVFVPSANIESSQVSSISIESALSTTADDFSQAVELNRSNTGTINVSNTNATLESYEIFGGPLGDEYSSYEGDTDSWSFTNTVWFGWTANASGNLTIDTCNSDFDTVLQAFDDDISIAANDDSASCGEEFVPSEISFNVQSGITYLIQLGGYEEQAGLAQLNWSFVSGAIAYSVTYDGNYEDTGTVPSDSTSYSSGDLVTVADDLGTLEKTGYSFNGWCTTQPAAGASCSGDTYGVGDEFAITGDTTLYAQWEGNELTVTIDVQGGTEIGPASTYSGASMSDPGTPTRTGYEFAGWFDVSTGGSRISFPYAHGEIADFTLYAQWTAPAEWIVGQTGPGGGKIFYVDMRRPAGSQYFEAACAGWSDGTCGGSDLTDPTAQWGCSEDSIIGANGTAIGTGERNTTDILAGCATSGIAARLADDLTLGGQSDWFLPSKDELDEMFVEKIRIGGFSADFYWSSSENVDGNASTQDFTSGNQYSSYKGSDPVRMRPVRSF